MVFYLQGWSIFLKGQPTRSPKALWEYVQSNAEKRKAAVAKINAGT